LKTVKDWLLGEPTLVGKNNLIENSSALIIILD